MNPTVVPPSSAISRNDPSERADPAVEPPEEAGAETRQEAFGDEPCVQRCRRRRGRGAADTHDDGVAVGPA